MKTIIVFFVVALGSVSHAFAHGEDKLGPHGGIIRMPGAFHTEIVAKGENAIDLYLLDINWKDPMVKDSSVVVTHLGSEKLTELTCEVSEKRFFCSSESLPLNSGSLQVKASRLGVQGIEVTYPLPLRVEPSEHGHKEVH